MKNIKEGDKVDVVFVDGIYYDSVLTHTPVATGDLWEFRDTDGNVHLVNPYSAKFVVFRKRKNL